MPPYVDKKSTLGDFVMQQPRRRARGQAAVGYVTPRPQMMLGESLAEYEAMRDAFFADLSPATAYERAIVTNIANCEWDLIRTYANRDNLLRLETLSIATSYFNTNTPDFFGKLEVSSDAEPMAHALMNPQFPRHSEVSERLAELSRSTGEIVALAFQNLMRTNTVLFDQMSALERRRARLRSEFEDLKRRRGPPIEDAQMIHEQ